jgi:hypothetical protein
MSTINGSVRASAPEGASLSRSSAFIESSYPRLM